MLLRPRDAAMYNVSEIADIPPIDRGPSCACCGMRFSRPADDGETQHCPRCQLHYPVAGEGPERELSRLRDHDKRLRPGYTVAWNFQNQFHDRMKSALHSRDTWKAALAEVLLQHEAAADGRGKLCHEREFPCSTWRKLERVK